MLAESGISPARISRRGYYTEQSPQRVGALGVTREGAKRVPGLVVPLFDVHEKVWGHQFRSDNPRTANGKTVKYETPRGQRNGLDVPPGIGAQVLDAGVPLWITEGSKKADAGVCAGLCVVSMSGVWNWTAPKKVKDESHRLMEALRSIPLDGRQVVLAFDGDVSRKPPVHQACETLASKLTERGAKVVYLHLPDTDDKTGLDDFLAAGHNADDLQALVHPSLPGTDAKPPSFNPCPVVYDGPDLDGAQLLDELRDWFGRYIGVVERDDLAVLALWAVHTHLAHELWTTPRVMLDSITPGSGKTTVLEHLRYLARNALHCTNALSKALVPRVLDQNMTTFLLDEVNRTLRPDGPSTEDLLAVINAGYKRGASAPTLVPGPDGSWIPAQFPCHAPVALAGNSPSLPADVSSRAIHILLMPALDDTIDDSDWEYIEPAIHELTSRVIAWADQVRGSINTVEDALPEDCRGRNRERWRPLKRVASAAGGDWPALVDRLVVADLERQQTEREEGALAGASPQVVALVHLREVWPKQARDTPAEFVSTNDLVRLLTAHDRRWTAESAFGRQLSPQRLGQLIRAATKQYSSRENERGPRGYFRTQLVTAWRHLRLGDE